MRTAILLAAGIIIPLLLTGCPNRQTTLRPVYVPAPPQPKNTHAEQSAVMTIPEPPPPQPARPAPKHAATHTVIAAVKPDEPPAREQPTSPAAPPAAAAPAPAGAPSADAPPLEPRSSVQEHAALEGQVAALKRDLRQRIAKLNRVPLSRDDVKALHDAQLFLAQTDQTMHQGDLQQSLNLAQKAELLVQAVEKRH